MKTVQELKKHSASTVHIDLSLEKYRGKVLFPKQIAKVNEMLKSAVLPKKISRSK